ncbi:hypothetical protein LIER_21598 [Lithospermum erythrorhizon]|uniref:C3H1-type domain-containing protein n=1 Tax=Lithospermum erythrorhizon TaxID=34254 RepID=A0AAV3QTW8_LITER
MSDHNPPPPRRPTPYPPDHWSNSDTFMINEYKIKHCPISTMPHDFAACPYTHVGDVYRRDHRYYNHEYCRANVVQNGKCHRGDQCQNAHGFYEYNYHPSRYRTMPCIHFGTNDCSVSGCPFYHFGYQQRPVTQNYDDDPTEREGPPLPPPRPDGNNPILPPLVYQSIHQQIPSFHHVMPPSQSSLPPPRNNIFRPCSCRGGNMFRPYSSPGVTIIRPSTGVNIFMPSSSPGVNIYNPRSSTRPNACRLCSATSFRPSSSTGATIFRGSSSTSAASFRPNSATSDATYRPPSATADASFRPVSATSFRPSSSTTAISRDPVPRPPEGQ